MLSKVGNRQAVHRGEPIGRLRGVWWGALACFVLAGLTGAFYRFGIRYGFTAGLDLVNIRHAHSHLMYFGWVTPALMALLALQVERITGRSLRVGGVLAAVFGAALLAYPLFLVFGYTPAAIGTARIPLAVIAASLNMIVWYVFVGRYVHATRGVPRTRAVLLWDLALVFLVVATLGAWGLALLKPLGVHSAVWSAALTHIFLDLFSEGWFVLGVLGLAYAVIRPEEKSAGHWSLWMICLGLPLTYALGMPETLVAPPAQVLARIGGTLVAVGLLANVAILGRAVRERPSPRWMWGLPLGLLAVKAFAELSVCVIPGVWWASLHGLRILYLHLMLLGFVTLGLVAAAGATWGRRAAQGGPWLYTAVLVLLASLLPLTTLWPSSWDGRWAFTAATWIALLPVAAAAGMLAVQGWRTRKSPRMPHPV